MTVTVSTEPMEASREAAKAAGVQTSSKPSSRQDLLDSSQQSQQSEITAATGGGNLPGSTSVSDQGLPVSSSRRNAAGGMKLPSAPPLSDAAEPTPPGASSGFMGLEGEGAINPEKLTITAMGQGTPTAAKLARGIVAVADMSSAAITRTAAAVGGAIGDYTSNLTHQAPPLSQPLTISKSYVNRLNLAQRFTQPAAYAADVVAQYAGELLYWLLQAALAVYYQLAAMKVLPQVAAGGKADARGVPINPVSGGLPLAVDELAAFKLVGAALLMAYVQVYDALEEAAQLLFRQASDAGQRYLAYRHGGEAADVAAAALGVAADVMTLTLNWFRMMGRAFFSKTATSTARGYLLQQLPDLHLD